MKENRRTTLWLVILGIIVLCLALFLGVKAIDNYNAQKIEDRLTQIFDEVDQDMAINQLSEIIGMIIEVKALSHEDIPQGVLFDELDRIISSDYFTNKYLDNFVFDIPNTSDVGELCEEFISQIDDQIYIIKYGAKGE